MSLLRAVQRAFERIAPTSLAAGWDNTGVLLDAVGTAKSQRKVVLCIDFTRAVLDALPPDTGVVVAYHPTIFSGLKSLRQDNALQRTLLHCAARGIAVYSPHTALDACADGIDDWLADGLEPHAKRQRIQPASHPPKGHESAGSGMLVSLSSAAAVDDVVQRVKRHLGLKTVMLARSATGPAQISTVALCAGSGGSVVKGSSADLIWTGEMGHHEILAFTAAGQHVILCNHSNTERGYLPILQGRLKELLAADEDGAGAEVIVSEADRDPLEFV